MHFLLLTNGVGKERSTEIPDCLFRLGNVLETEPCIDESDDHSLLIDLLGILPRWGFQSHKRLILYCLWSC